MSKEDYNSYPSKKGVLKYKKKLISEIRNIILKQVEFTQYLTINSEHPLCGDAYLKSLLVKKLSKEELNKLKLTFYNIDVYDESIEVEFGFKYSYWGTLINHSKQRNVQTGEYLSTIKIDLKKEIRELKLNKILS